MSGNEYYDIVYNVSAILYIVCNSVRYSDVVITFGISTTTYNTYFIIIISDNESYNVNY